MNNATAPSSDYWVFTLVSSLLPEYEPVLTRPVRAGLYQALGRMPGAWTTDGPVTVAGRSVHVVSVTDDYGSTASLLFDPKTAVWSATPAPTTPPRDR